VVAITLNLNIKCNYQAVHYHKWETDKTMTIKLSVKHCAFIGISQDKNGQKLKGFIWLYIRLKSVMFSPNSWIATLVDCLTYTVNHLVRLNVQYTSVGLGKDIIQQ